MPTQKKKKKKKTPLVVHDMISILTNQLSTNFWQDQVDNLMPLPAKRGHSCPLQGHLGA